MAKKVRKPMLKSRSGPSGASGKSGRSGKSTLSGTRTSGRSGASGRSGRRGRSNYAAAAQTAAKKDLLTFVLASLLSTLGKVQGHAVQAKATKAVRRTDADLDALAQEETWSTHHRCEASARLDSATLELYAAGVESNTHQRLALSWLLRAVLSGSGLLSMVLTQYAADAKDTFLNAVHRRRLDPELLATILRRIVLGNATPEARMQQWSEFRRKAYVENLISERRVPMS